MINVCISHARIGVATIYNDGMNGYIKFEQTSASDSVTISVNITGLNSRANGYHVHELPVNFGGSGLKSNSAGLGCGFGITADHFNPLEVPGGANVPGDYLCSQTNQAACEAGDISGKFGGLKDKLSVLETFEDNLSGLTLFGVNSIIGRSIVIHEVDTGTRIVCATIFPDADLKKTVATFDRSQDGVEGTVSLFRDRSNTYDPFVFVNVQLGVENLFNTLTASLAVHEFPMLEALEVDKFVRCGATSLGNSVLSLLDVELDKQQRTKTLSTLSQTDIDSLSTASLSIYDNELLIDCAEFGKRAYSQFKAEDHDGVEGNIIFYQPSEDEEVRVTVDLKGLASRANLYHVHTLPVFSDCVSTTGHYNPLNVVGGDGNQDGPYACSKTDPAACESGDLSGRFGGLLGASDVRYTFEDIGAGLNLFGTNSIIGRSIVIHRQDATNSRLTCSNILELGKISGETVSFSHNINEVQGSVTLSQRAVDADSETSIRFDIKKNDQGGSLQHMFHIHETPLTSGTTDCLVTEGHYSPTAVNGGAGQMNNEYLCTNLLPEFCEVGDISGKHDFVDLPKKMILTDPSIPLTGIFSIADLSITFHGESRKPDRIDCANLNSFSSGLPTFSDNDPDPTSPTVPSRPPSPTSFPSVNNEDSSNDTSTTEGFLIFFCILFGMVSMVLGIYIVTLRNKVERIETRLADAEVREDEQVKQATL